MNQSRAAALDWEVADVRVEVTAGDRDEFLAPNYHENHCNTTQPASHSQAKPTAAQGILADFF